MWVFSSKHGLLSNTLLHPRQYRHSHQAPVLPPLCIFQQFSCMTGGMPYIGNQMVHMVYHIPIGSNNGKTPWHPLHLRRIISIVKSIRWVHRTLRRMIWEQQAQTNFRMLLLGFQHSLPCPIVKSTIVAHNKFGHTQFHNMPLNFPP